MTDDASPLDANILLLSTRGVTLDVQTVARHLQCTPEEAEEALDDMARRGVVDLQLDEDTGALSYVPRGLEAMGAAAPARAASPMPSSSVPSFTSGSIPAMPTAMPGPAATSMPTAMPGPTPPSMPAASPMPYAPAPPPPTPPSAPNPAYAAPAGASLLRPPAAPLAPQQRKHPMVGMLWALLIPGFGLFYAAPLSVALLAGFLSFSVGELFAAVPLVGVALSPLVMVACAVGSALLSLVYVKRFNEVGTRAHLEDDLGDRILSRVR